VLQALSGTLASWKLEVGSWQLAVGSFAGSGSASSRLSSSSFTLVRSAECRVKTAKQIGPVHLARREKQNKIQTPRRRLRPSATDCNRRRLFQFELPFKHPSRIFQSWPRVNARLPSSPLHFWCQGFFCPHHIQTPVTSLQPCVLVEQILVTGTVDRRIA
jgi:hypothetical protein